MSILIDANIIISYLVESDKNHKKSISLFNSLTENIRGTWYVTDFVIDEVLTVLWSKLRRKDIVEKAYYFITSDETPFTILLANKVDLDDIWNVWQKYAEYPKRPLSFTDASLITIAKELKIDYIDSFDDEFNGLVSVLN